MASSLAYQALRQTHGPCVLFESTGAGGPLARRSILARHPSALLIVDADGSRVVRSAGAQPGDTDLRHALRALWREARGGVWPHEGGIAGLLAYDAARPGRPHADTPLLVAMVVDGFLVEEEGRLLAAGPPMREPLPGPRAPAAQSVQEPPVELHLPTWSSLTRRQHRSLVQRLQEYIGAGDIYQANLSQRFCLPWARGGLALYDWLRQTSPAPFSGYARFGDLELASASPERLLLVEGTQLRTRPIAGTRPRGDGLAADLALRVELLLSEKERAEHLMLVDLARNDLGMVASIGSVGVDELMVVEDYSHVRHIVSNVKAELRPASDPIDALFALFPGGTITGVPKRRCMEILDAVEPVPRGLYTGAMFYLTASGRLDANILIRSAVVWGGAVTFHAGGGIVADSEPDREYAETLHKAEGLRLALQACLRDPASAPGHVPGR